MKCEKNVYFRIYEYKIYEYKILDKKFILFNLGKYSRESMIEFFMDIFLKRRLNRFLFIWMLFKNI